MPPHRVVVLGATGQMGARVTDELRRRGYDVVGAARSTGVDAYAGTGLREAFEGAGTVVDCLNHQTFGARRAIDFFTTTAGNVAAAARGAGVGHLVCLSIVNAGDPAVAKAMGYYAGKAAQAQTYAVAGLPVTMACTTQWFELTRQLLHLLRVGPVALVPRMPVRPVAARSVARFLCDAVAAGTRGPTHVELAGPEVTDTAEACRRVAAALEPGTRVVALPLPGKALRHGGLLPREPVRTDDVTLEQWLRDEIERARP